MNTNDEIMPISDDLKLNFIFTNDSIGFQSHPSLQLFQHQKVLAKSQTNFEKAKLLPEISFGYFNTSIKGNGADNSFYTSSTRFNSFQIGIGVPIFFKAQQYRIKSSFIQQQIADNNFQNHFDEMKNEWKAYELQYSNNLQMVSYYEKSALTNAKLIESTAQQQFANGEINYLEWTMLINQSMAIQNNYLDILKSLNESIINIQYLNSK
jgi:cobalt-zinc-cadmium resistance protein CzcA